MIALLALTALATAEPILEPGLYRLDTVLVTESKVPFHGRVRAWNTSTALVRLDRDGTGWRQEQRLCRVGVTDDSRVAETVIPQAFVDATPVQAFPVRFVAEGDGWRYIADPGPLDVGWDPVAAGGVLPSEPDDPGVVDWEGDGTPGATVQLDVPVFRRVDLYVVQRGHSVFSGTVRDGMVHGLVEVVHLEQHTVDATNGWFEANLPTEIVAADSTFRLAPVPPGSTCASLP